MEVKFKNTKQRSAIIEILKDSKKPLSADEIFVILKEKGSSGSLATVYRTLDMFSEKGVLSKLNIKDNKAKYELNEGTHYHHLVCLNCDSTVKIEACPIIHAFQKKLKNDTQFNIVGHRFEMYGYCPKCTK